MVKIYNAGEDIAAVLTRSQMNMENVNAVVKQIVAAVRTMGDRAVFDYCLRFDGLELNAGSVLVTEQEIAAAYAEVDKETLDALRRAKDNITEFHLRQIRQDDIRTTDGKTTGIMIRPVERAGLYVPGGKAAYPSSVLMCAVPALVAGVKEIIMCTPAGKGLNALTLVAAAECGIKKIFKIGGAQAVAAMGLGTESVPRVNVIAGPGNIYVAMAKRQIFGDCGVDMIAGPSEILIIADESANPAFLAADMLSQAEHDELSMSTLITDCPAIAEQTRAELEKQIELLSKKDIAKKSLEKNGAIIVTESIEKAFEISNAVAPEHLELCLKGAAERLKDVLSAGAVFVGNFSPEPLGDYYAGTNHVLPTSGTAKFFSALSVENYIKRISVVSYTEGAIKACGADIVQLAEAEGLTAHAQSVRIRL